MTIPVEVLEAQVRSLPAPLPSRLLDKLIAGLDTDPEWEEAWAAEADRREAAITSGQAKKISGDEALVRACAKLA